MIPCGSCVDVQIELFDTVFVFSHVPGKLVEKREITRKVSRPAEVKRRLRLVRSA